MPTAKQIRRRIASVKSTQKITRAMKMVAAAKLRRAQENITRMRPYALQTLEVLSSVAARAGDEEVHPLLARREQGKSAGDIITVDQFADFELLLEWKMTTGNNSGVIYRATEQHDQVWQSGPEYQILDNTTHLDGLNILASAGACYAVFAPAKDATRLVGQWNQTRILAAGKHVEHWMNGEKLVEYDIGSNRWQAHVKTSKFFPTAYGQGNRGLAEKGHIGLQDYGGAIEFRNIKIRLLTADNN